MLLLAPLLLVLAPSRQAEPAPYRCAGDLDCELLGACVAGACHCRPGFTGPSCGRVDLAPAAAETGGAVWPQADELRSNSSFSWGFTVVKDDSTGLYHAAVNVGCCDLPSAVQPPTTCSVTVAGTFLLHITSKYPDRGWEPAGVFMAPTAFNPHLIRAPNGTYILYFRVNDLAEYPACDGAHPNRTNSSALPTYIDRADITHTDPSGEGPGANMYVAWADTMAGPWKARKVEITGMGSLHISNPSIALLADHRVMLAYRFNPSHGEQNGFAMAESFLGPFVSSANLTKAPGNDEDPFLWQEKQDGSLHILYHNGPRGLHAFSADGITWRKSPTNSSAFALSVSYTDGHSIRLARRERPEILFGASGAPLFLYNGVNTESATLPPESIGDGVTHQMGRSRGFGHAFSLVQPVRGGPTSSGMA